MILGQRGIAGHRQISLGDICRRYVMAGYFAALFAVAADDFPHRAAHLIFNAATRAGTGFCAHLFASQL